MRTRNDMQLLHIAITVSILFSSVCRLKTCGLCAAPEPQVEPRSPKIVLPKCQGPGYRRALGTADAEI